MTPEEAGIYSADSHMRHLVNWMIKNDITTFKLRDLPEQFSRKWHTKSIYAQHLESVSAGNTNVRTWKVAGIYDNARQTRTHMIITERLHNGLTLDVIRDSIGKGITSPLYMAKHLNMSQSATYRALKKYCKAGKLTRISGYKYIHYLLDGVNAEEYKHCPHCNRLMKMSDFGKRLSTVDGLENYCKDCTRNYSTMANPLSTNYKTTYTPDEFQFSEINSDDSVNMEA